MANSNLKNVPASGADEILELLPGMTFLPGEDEMTYEGLKHAFSLDLTPQTPYEKVLVQNLLTLEWEAIRHRTLRDSLILAEYRDQAMGVFQEGKAGKVRLADLSEEAEDAAFALVNPDPEIRQGAEKKLAEFQITRQELLAKAYRLMATSLDFHERKLADIEIRRRRLREDYDKVKSTRSKPVLDAEIVEG